MALARWKDLCIDADDAEVLARFWGAVLGLRVEPADRGAVLRGDDPGRTVWVNPVPEPKQVKNRVHLDLLRPGVDRLVDLGARVLAEHDHRGVRWTVLADPEGNELCAFDQGPDALVVDSADPVAAAAWWADVLGLAAAEDPWGTPRWLVHVPGLPWEAVKFVGVPDERRVKNRWHWDVVCDDVPALVARGARVLREPDDDVRWHVLADPEGNEFCAFAGS